MIPEKKEYSERRISAALEDLLEQRSSYSAASDGAPLKPIEGIDSRAIAMTPIISAGDVAGYGEADTLPLKELIELGIRFEDALCVGGIDTCARILHCIDYQQIVHIH